MLRSFQLWCAQGAALIGINNRNLHTFSVDPSTSTRLIQVREAFFACTAASNLPIVDQMVPAEKLRKRGQSFVDDSVGVSVIALSGIQ